MGTYSTLTNQPIDIHLEDDWYDNGWSISSGKAVHVSCNEGTIKNDTMPTEAGETYKVVFTVSGYSSGEVYPIIGGTNGTAVTANGTYEQEITAADATGLKFWSDGDLTVELVRVSLGEVPAATFSFNKETLKWTSYWSYAPDMMAKFLDGYYSWKDGQLWVHDENELRNNFYGEQYPSIITFYFNVNPTQVKTLSSMRIVGSSPWEVLEVLIRPRMGKSKGQRSRIRKNRFNNLQGQFFADFMRDMDDPRFVDENVALRKGAVLQGEVAKITMQVTGPDEVRLLGVDILGPDSQFTY